MKITADLLAARGACVDQVAEVRRLWPRGAEPTDEDLTQAEAHGLNWLWLVCLLPAEGPGSQRAFALWCAEQVAHLADDQRVADCLDVVRRRVADPSSVSDVELAAAWAAAWAAASAAGAAASAAWAAGDAAGAAQRAQLAVLLAAAEEMSQ